MAGTLVHFEFPVQDPDRETEFCAAVFGRDIEDSGMPDTEGNAFSPYQRDESAAPPQ